jgi:hypothetical protein
MPFSGQLIGLEKESVLGKPICQNLPEPIQTAKKRQVVNNPASRLSTFYSLCVHNLPGRADTIRVLRRTSITKQAADCRLHSLQKNALF